MQASTSATAATSIARAASDGWEASRGPISRMNDCNVYLLSLIPARSAQRVTVAVGAVYCVYLIETFYNTRLRL